MASSTTKNDPLRFRQPHLHLNPAFGASWFGARAEAFARLFGTPGFLIGQTLVVALWVSLNATGITKFDLYPFIFLNLAFSLQSAYAAPLILLAQTRQADRDKASAEADANHREAVAQTNLEQNERILQLLEQNTELTRLTQQLSARIEVLAGEIHRKVISPQA